jgi:hypothetical protein
LCDLDYYLPTPDDREIIINKIKKSSWHYVYYSVQLY